MTEAKIVTAVRETLRFLRRAEALAKRMNDDPEFAKYLGITGSKETAALRRASLDLSRALANMRRR